MEVGVVLGAGDNVRTASFTKPNFAPMCRMRPGPRHTALDSAAMASDMITTLTFSPISCNTCDAYNQSFWHNSRHGV